MVSLHGGSKFTETPQLYAGKLLLTGLKFLLLSEIPNADDTVQTAGCENVLVELVGR